MKLRKRLSVAMVSALIVSSIYSPVFANDNNVKVEVNNEAVVLTTSQITTASSVSLCPTKNCFPNTKLLKGSKLVAKATGKTLVDYNGNIYNTAGTLIAKSDGSFVAKTGEILIDAAGNILDEEGKIAIYANGEVNKEVATVRLHTNDQYKDICEWEMFTKGIHGRMQKLIKGGNQWIIRDKANNQYRIDESKDNYGVLMYRIWLDEDTVIAIRPSEHSSNILFKSVGNSGFCTQGDRVFYDENTMSIIKPSSHDSSDDSSSDDDSSDDNTSTDEKINDTSKENIPDKKDEVVEQTKLQEETTQAEKVKEPSKEINKVTKEVIKNSRDRVLTNTVKKVKFKIGINGSSVGIQEDILEQEGRTMLQLRNIAEALDFKVQFNIADKVAIIEKNDLRIEFPLGCNVAIVNGKVVPIDTNNDKVRSIVVNGRTYLPVRFIAESLGLKVDFNQGTISINNK